MADCLVESIHNLLASDSESISDSSSSRGSYHPSHKCFMADGPYHKETLEGHVESVHGGEVTPLLDPDDEVGADKRVPPNPRLE
jgi:hypothetical protein